MRNSADNTITFNNTAGMTIRRELLAAYVNIGTFEDPEWEILGKRVSESSQEFDWADESENDITGSTYGDMKKPVITQAFDDFSLTSGDKAHQFLWKLGLEEQDSRKLSDIDLLIVHFYANAPFSDIALGERYPSSMLAITTAGGEGGGQLKVSVEVTYGGERTVGVADISSGKLTFVTEWEVSANLKTQDGKQIKTVAGQNIRATWKESMEG